MELTLIVLTKIDQKWTLKRINIIVLSKIDHWEFYVLMLTHLEDTGT